ncbi:hypothetical protein [Sphingomonas solaris]|uniref:Flagellar protein FlgN n=1 Tax=Alterirhizorhabdus solaris TaxID=2529389 RepID=A0A558QRD7_9SPHN|nr:hypothetical protein [Sphingomonas solaris]TVV69632.1 hypothetical protein FOY91_21260 [Sphingomonas solaris]
MSEMVLDRLIASQESLIAALDGDEAEAIEQALTGFAEAIGGLKGVAGWRDAPSVVTRVTHALQLAEAARIRTVYLADRPRRQIERLTAAGSGRVAAGLAYGRNGMMRA